MFHALRLDGLWRHPDFLRLWAGHTVSLAGSLISRFALPLVAILTLDASPGPRGRGRRAQCCLLFMGRCG